MSRFHFKHLKAISHRIPLRRDKHKNPVDRPLFSSRPLIQRSPETLRLAAWSCFRDPDEAQRLMPLVWTESAIALEENKAMAQDEMALRIQADNDRNYAGVKRLTIAIKEMAAEEQILVTEFSKARSSLPIKSSLEDEDFDFAEDEPERLEVTSSRLGLNPLFKVKAIPRPLVYVAGATVLAAGYGPLVDAGDLRTIGDNPTPYICLFIAAFILLWAVSTCIELGATWIGVLAEKRMASSSRRGQKFEKLLIALVGLTAMAIVMSETTTERVGIFQSMATPTTMTGIAITPSELQWIVLLVVVPTVFLAFFRGLWEGSQAVIKSRLLGARDDYRNRLRETESFRSARSLHRRVRFLRESRTKLEAELSRCQAGIRFDFNEFEKQQLEDLDADSIGASKKVEDVFAGSFGSTDHLRKTTVRPWAALWGWLGQLWRPRGQNAG